MGGSKDCERQQKCVDDALSQGPGGPLDPCKDDPEWNVDGVKEKNCGWVSMSTSNRCEDENQDGVKANTACPVACSKTDNCLTPICLKNKKWKPEDNSFKNCKSIKRMNKVDKYEACAMVGKDEVTFGYEACKFCKK